MLPDAGDGATRCSGSAVGGRCSGSVWGAEGAVLGGWGRGRVFARLTAGREGACSLGRWCRGLVTARCGFARLQQDAGGMLFGDFCAGAVLGRCCLRCYLGSMLVYFSRGLNQMGDAFLFSRTPSNPPKPPAPLPPSPPPSFKKRKHTRHQANLIWWFRFDPLVLVEGKWEGTHPNHQRGGS